MCSETRLIKLHRVFGKPIYVNTAQVCAVYEMEDNTIVSMVNQDKFLVRETPEQVLGINYRPDPYSPPCRSRGGKL